MVSNPPSPEDPSNHGKKTRSVRQSLASVYSHLLVWGFFRVALDLVFFRGLEAELMDFYSDLAIGTGVLFDEIFVKTWFVRSSILVRFGVCLCCVCHGISPV